LINSEQKRGRLSSINWSTLHCDRELQEIG
jgi:hypothetical protein